MSPIVCFNCNKERHYASRCPDRASSSSQGERRTHLVQDDEYQEKKMADSDSVPERGEILMMKRRLLKVPTTMEPAQRKIIFGIACKFGGKVCKVIIDSGSTENLVSLKMVEKLKLRRIPHPFPYKLSWLMKGQQTLVNEQAWVDF